MFPRARLGIAALLSVADLFFISPLGISGAFHSLEQGFEALG